MTVAVAGNLITQSGIDTDASIQSALLAIAGVTSIAESAGCVRLVVPFRFQVTGTLTTTSLSAFTFSRAGNPANEVVIGNGTTGRWNYKESRTVNGFTDWRVMPPMIFTQNATAGYNGETANIIYQNGGIQDFAKIELRGNGGHYWRGGQVIHRDVFINGEGLPLVNDSQITTQAGNPILDIDGLEYRGCSVFLRDFVTVQLNRLQPKFAARGFGSGFGLTKVLQDFDGKGTGFDLSIFGGGLIRANNPVRGGGVTCGPWNSPNNVNNEYQCTADLVLTGINDIDAAVQFKAYHLDNNAGAPAGAGISGTNYTLRKVYNQLSTVGGVNTLNILTGSGLNDNAMVRRSAVQTGDLYAFTCFSYLSEPTVTTSINLAGAGTKLARVLQLRDQAISQTVKATVDAYTQLETLDKLYDRAKAHAFDNFAGETTTIFAANGTTLDAGARNIVIDSAALATFALAGNAITIKATAFTAGVKFKSLATAGTVTVANGSSVSGLTISANVIQATPTDLTNVSITGTLTYNTAAATPVTFTNVTASTVTNSGAGLVTVKRVNSNLTAGTNVTSYVPTVLVFTLAGGRIRVLDNLGVEQFNQTVDGTFELPAAATGTWTYRIAKYGSSLISSSFVVDGTTKSITASYIPDLNVVDTQANAQAYTDLETTQKIYDRLAHYQTTALGIADGVLAAKGFGTLTVPAGLTLDAAAVAIVTVSAGVVTAKSSGLAEAVTLLSSGSIIAPVLSNAVKVRGLNLDSELVYSVDSLTFYPTLIDRDSGANAGLTVTGGVYRFKSGAVVSGVTLNGSVYMRVRVGVTTLFAELPFIAGTNLLDLGVQTQLSAISAKILDTTATRAAVWDAVKANHTIVGSTGAALGTGSGGGAGGATLAEIEGSDVIAKQVTAAATLSAVQALPVPPTTAQIWTNATRTLTASLDPTAAQVAAQVRSELTTELARLDVPVGTRLATTGYTAPNNAAIGTTLTAVQALPNAAQTATAVANTVVDGTVTTRQAVSVLLAGVAGKASGLGTATETYVAQDGTTPRIVTTFDAAGNRITVNLTP